MLLDKLASPTVTHSSLIVLRTTRVVVPCDICFYSQLSWFNRCNCYDKALCNLVLHDVIGRHEKVIGIITRYWLLQLLLEFIWFWSAALPCMENLVHRSGTITNDSYKDHLQMFREPWKAAQFNRNTIIVCPWQFEGDFQQMATFRAFLWSRTAPIISEW